jgi:hypothetical protein
MIDFFINLLDAVVTLFNGVIRGIREYRCGNARRWLWIWTAGGFLIGIGILVFLAAALVSD